MHPRRLIRAQVVALLLGTTAVADRVYNSTKLGRKRSELPFISVYTPVEALQEDAVNVSPQLTKRQLTLAIEVRVGSTESVNAADQLDDICWQVEEVTTSDPTLNGTAANTSLQVTEIELEPEGDRVTALATMVYAVEYWVSQPTNQGSLDDFLTVYAQYNQNNNTDPGDQVAQQFEVQP